MITSFFINIFLNIVIFLVELLPTGSLPSEFSTAIQAIVGYLYIFNGIFPVDTFITLLTYAIVLQVAVLLWRFIMFILTMIRGN